MTLSKRHIELKNNLQTDICFLSQIPTFYNLKIQKALDIIDIINDKIPHTNNKLCYITLVKYNSSEFMNKISNLIKHYSTQKRRFLKLAILFGRHIDTHNDLHTVFNHSTPVIVDTAEKSIILLSNDFTYNTSLQNLQAELQKYGITMQFIYGDSQNPLSIQGDGCSCHAITVTTLKNIDVNQNLEGVKQNIETQIIRLSQSTKFLDTFIPDWKKKIVSKNGETGEDYRNRYSFHLTKHHETKLASFKLHQKSMSFGELLENHYENFNKSSVQK